MRRAGRKTRGNQEVKKSKRLFELSFKNRTGRRIEASKKEVKYLPKVYAPTKKQIREAANAVGLKVDENGKLVGRVKKEDYRKFEEELLKKMGLREENLTLKKASERKALERLFPEGVENKHMNVLYFVNPKEVDRLVTAEKAGVPEEEVLKIAYPKEYAKWKRANGRVPLENALEEARLKEMFPDAWKEFRAIYKKKGMSYKDFLKSMKEFEKKQAAKKRE